FGSDATSNPAVEDASLAAHPGEVVMILGPSGSGKTTLLSILGGLLRATGGTVRIDGALLDSTRAETSQLRLERVGFVFQSYNLLPALTTVENVALPLRLRGLRRSAALAEATHMLSALELADRL